MLFFVTKGRNPSLIDERVVNTELENIKIVYDKYFKDVYKYVLSLTQNQDLAEELTQETFFKAVKSIDTFDGRCTLFVWLCQIAKNTYFTHYQKSKRYSSIEEQTLETAECFEQVFVNQESAFEIHKVLHKLDEPYKEVFSLRVFGELSFQQIGLLFNKTESWARVTYHRAKIKIQEEIL